jgi:hypothetical protein
MDKKQPFPKILYYNFIYDEMKEKGSLEALHFELSLKKLF